MSRIIFFHLDSFSMDFFLPKCFCKNYLLLWLISPTHNCQCVISLIWCLDKYLTICAIYSTHSTTRKILMKFDFSFRKYMYKYEKPRKTWGIFCNDVVRIAASSLILSLFSKKNIFFVFFFQRIFFFNGFLPLYEVYEQDAPEKIVIDSHNLCLSPFLQLIWSENVTYANQLQALLLILKNAIV